MKTCPCCNRQLPATDHFYDIDPDSRDGLTLFCWRCRQETPKLGLFDGIPITVYTPPDPAPEPAAPIVPIRRSEKIAQRDSRRITAKLNSIRSAARAALGR